MTLESCCLGPAILCEVEGALEEMKTTGSWVDVLVRGSCCLCAVILPTEVVLWTILPILTIAGERHGWMTPLLTFKESSNYMCVH